MNQSTWSAGQPCEGWEGRGPMRMGGGVGPVPEPERTNERRRKLGANWEAHSMWSQVGTSESGHQMANGTNLRLSTRWWIIAQPPSFYLSCNCQRARPPYGGWPYTYSSIECLHTLTLLSMQRPKVAKQLHPPTAH